MTEQELEVVHTMATHGGSFVGALAEAFYLADRANFTKLTLAFPEYWKQYEEMAEQIRKSKYDAGLKISTNRRHYDPKHYDYDSE